MSASLTWRAGSLFLRSEEHTSKLQSPDHLVCRLLLEKKKKKTHSRSAVSTGQASFRYTSSPGISYDLSTTRMYTMRVDSQTKCMRHVVGCDVRRDCV